MKKEDKDLFIDSFKKNHKTTINVKKYNRFLLNFKYNKPKADLKGLKNILYRITSIIFVFISILGLMSLLLINSFTNLYSEDNIKKISEITNSVNQFGLEQSSYKNLYFVELAYENKNLILIIIIGLIIITFIIAMIIEALRRKNVK